MESVCITYMESTVVIVIVNFYSVDFSFNALPGVIAFKQTQTVFTNSLFFSIITLNYICSMRFVYFKFLIFDNRHHNYKAGFKKQLVKDRSNWKWCVHVSLICSDTSGTARPCKSCIPVLP